jgi:hypothetical protein
MPEHRCNGFKATGEQCKRVVNESFSYCYAHDPNTLEERRRNAVKSGKGNAQKELRNLKRRLSKLFDDVLEGKIDTRRAAVAANVSNALARVHTVSLQIKEVEELEGRIEELESSLREEADRW